MRSLDELFDLRDMAFVEAAYLLMLQRPADSIGRAYYLGRLRSGYSQISVLDQLWRAPDAEPLWSEAPKLREQLERYRNAIRPPIGLWRRRFDPVFGVSRSLRRARAIENELARTRQEILAKCADLSSEVTLLRDFVGRIADDRQSSSPGRMTMKLSSNAPVGAQSWNVRGARDIELSSVGRDVLRSLRD
jgi:hypothetical protein